jgi:hypothetical protein
MYQPFPVSDLVAVIENNLCTDHRLKPSIAFTEHSITFSCCCSLFHSECTQLAKELSDMSGFTDLTIE